VNADAPPEKPIDSVDPVDGAREPVLSVVMPAYNEEATVLDTIARVLAVPVDLELIVVDDGSTDGTRALLHDHYGDHPRVRVIFQPFNQGKGAACRTGFAHARGRYVVIQDADAEYDPNELPKLLEPLLDDRADVVFGSRYLHAPLELRQSWHTRANNVFTAMSNAVTPMKFTDVHTCYKLVRRDILLGLSLQEPGFGMDQELAIKVAQRGCRIVEVPIRYAPRSYAAGKKLGPLDAARIAWCIARYGVPGLLRR
jgi:glycosyltransferase involved in cell wall biosynthesis